MKNAWLAPCMTALHPFRPPGGENDTSTHANMRRGKCTTFQGAATFRTDVAIGVCSSGMLTLSNLQLGKMRGVACADGSLAFVELLEAIGNEVEQRAHGRAHVASRRQYGVYQLGPRCPLRQQLCERARAQLVRNHH
jgi:hypothetical protein